LESYKSGAALPFPIIVDDIAGNSHLENPYDCPRMGRVGA